MKIETFDKIIVSSFLEKNAIIDFVKANYPSDEKLQENKIRSIRRYVNGEVVPSYSKARELIDMLGIEISEQELLDILEYSSDEKEINEKYSASFINNLTIRYSDLFTNRNMTTYELDQFLNKRIDEICTSKKRKDKLKEYLIMLIEKDLDNEILDKK